MGGIKQWLFLRKLNKAIKGYGAKAHIHKDMLHIIMRGYSCAQSYSDLKFQYKSEKDLICHVIQQIKIKNVKEAYE